MQNASSEQPFEQSKAVGQKEEEENLQEGSFWDRIPKYHWWVTPVNLLVISLFLFIIDLVTPPNTHFLRIDWAWWPIGGLFFAYAVSFIIFKRPAIAWIIGPIMMVGVSGMLLAIDLVFGPNNGLIGLDWATIPIAALLAFGVFIPIITKLGRKKKKPTEKFRRAVAQLQKRETQNQRDGDN
ncbi:MAG: hypothetical protein GF308_04205 [Candidatus Heimdallarchaeota archaeon]|nr:hypothetical protein [Candidatus Heimdallarchaeota archaeon]